LIGTVSGLLLVDGVRLLIQVAMLYSWKLVMAAWPRPAGFGFSPLMHPSAHGSVSLQHGLEAIMLLSYRKKKSLDLLHVLFVGKKDIGTEASVVL
jgi:hypothetical protein